MSPATRQNKNNQNAYLRRNRIRPVVWGLNCGGRSFFGHRSQGRGALHSTGGLGPSAEGEEPADGKRIFSSPSRRIST